MQKQSGPAAVPLRTTELVWCAMFTVLMAVCAWVSIPVPKPFVPFTMQTFAVFAAVLLLGGRRGLYAIAAYLLLGAVGLPVFAGFHGGLGVLLGTTGGYLIGFLALALVYWVLDAVLPDGPVWKALACAAGLLVCYAFGTAWFMIAYASSTGPVGLGTALGWCVIPFLIPDAVKLALALIFARRLNAFVLERLP